LDPVEKFTDFERFQNLTFVSVSTIVQVYLRRKPVMQTHEFTLFIPPAAKLATKKDSQVKILIYLTETAD
jgi:hypothetical protein